ncbi:MAG: hypothetical protein II842_05755 [Butyrivibrio sp.]|nr:hypothetical protein [Butyrivibrio sp.]
MIGIYLLMIHLCIVFFIFILMRMGIFKVDSVMMTVILCIPFWGVICAICITILVNSGNSGEKRKELDTLSGTKLTVESVPVPVTESGNIVPLEDALIMDDSSVRRSVMLDVLMQDTKAYIPVLNQARMNDDVEVVHYATTAMATLSKEYELKLQELGTKYAENPRDTNLLDEYITFLGQYIRSGMISGQFLEIQQNTYHQLLAEKVNLSPNIEDYAGLAKSLIEAKQYIWADTALKVMEEKWPADDRTWLLRFRYYYETGSGSKIEEMIQKVSEGGFYSRKVREVVGFWNENNGRLAT